MRLNACLVVLLLALGAVLGIAAEGFGEESGDSTVESPLEGEKKISTWDAMSGKSEETPDEKKETVPEEPVDRSRRPYELEWAGRKTDTRPPLVDFTEDAVWKVQTKNGATAQCQNSSEQWIFGKTSLRLTYRALSAARRDWKVPEIEIRREKLVPIPVPEKKEKKKKAHSAIDAPLEAMLDMPAETTDDPNKPQGNLNAISCWIYGDKRALLEGITPIVSAIFALPDGSERRVPLATVNWQEWSLAYHVLSPEERIWVNLPGSSFVGFCVEKGDSEEDRDLFFANFCLFEESTRRPGFTRRPRRAVSLADGRSMGLNTGNGRLSFPTLDRTMMPVSMLRGSLNTLTLSEDGVFTLNYEGADGKLSFYYTPVTGKWSDFKVRWNDGRVFSPMEDGGISLLVDETGKEVPVNRVQLVKSEIASDGNAITSTWLLSTKPEGAKGITVEVTYRFRMTGKTLVIDVSSRGGRVAEIKFGALRNDNFDKYRLFKVPYLTYSTESDSRPGVVSFEGLFMSGLPDWYLSNGSQIYGDCLEASGQIRYSGGVRYLPKTNGQRNDCYERFLLTVSTKFSEVLPNIANPPSPWRKVTSSGLWHKYSVSNDRSRDKMLWRNLWRYGIRDVVLIEDKKSWCDGGESFSFRTKAAPQKGGDEGLRDVTQFMQDKLGYRYAAYCNFSDLSPLNELWDIDSISRAPDGSLQTTSPGFYVFKPPRTVEQSGRFSSFNHQKYRVSAGYCDQLTQEAPWERTDYDFRVPGAGTLTGAYYAYGEMLLLQKRAWNGPIVSSGGCHWLYSGLCDGNLAWDATYDWAEEPWLVDFDLQRMHDLENNFGMGTPAQFFRDTPDLSSMGDVQKDARCDRYTAATAAFGHVGYLMLEYGIKRAWRNYFLLQHLQQAYGNARVGDVMYLDEDDHEWDFSMAVANGAIQRNHLKVQYQNGTTVVANGSHTETLRTVIGQRVFELPPGGFWGRTVDDSVESFSGTVYSGQKLAHRADYAVSPEYLFVDGRGSFARFPNACGNGPGMCRVLNENTYEIILLEGAECGFRIPAVLATAYDFKGQEIGPTKIRYSRGYVFVEPVEGAFSYLLRTEVQAADLPKNTLQCRRDTGVPGEKITVHGLAAHTIEIPQTAKSGERLWFYLEDEWIDFTVTSLCDVFSQIQGDKLLLELTPRVPDFESLSLSILYKGRVVQTQTIRRLENGSATARMSLANLKKAGRMTFDYVIQIGERKQPGCMVLEVLYQRKTFPQDMVRQNLTRETTETTGYTEQEDPLAILGRPKVRVQQGKIVCGGIEKDSVQVVPRQTSRAGDIWMEGMIRIPDEVVSLRAEVGRMDGSPSSEPIVYRIGLVDSGGRLHVLTEKKVTTRGWAPIEASLEPWRGQMVRLRLISNVSATSGYVDNPACWADIRVETTDEAVHRRIISVSP